jgi:hypothetical protein
MSPEALYSLSADLILLLHFAFVVFVVLGLVLIVVGKFLHWSWVRNPWFRLLHLIAIGFVVLETWLGMICPLTIWELTLKEKAGNAVYSGAFIAHWVERILYYRAQAWVFYLGYTVFGGLVLACWFWVRPRAFKSRDNA